MKKLFTGLVWLLIATMPVLSQSSQCIFQGSVMIHGEIFPNPCSTDPPIIQLLTHDGDSSRTAVYNPSTQSYGISVYDTDGFNDSDVVTFRILYNCDTMIARTNGDEAIFIGSPFPTPPEPREVNLFNNRTPYFTYITSDTAREDFLYQRQMFAFDADSDDVTFSLVEAPLWLSIDEQSGFIHGTPGASDVGTHQITVEVNDGYFRGTSQMTYTLHVLHTNHTPSLFHLLTPTMFDTLEYHPSDNVMFSWRRSFDADAGDVVGYELVVVNLNLDTLRFSTTDTFKTIAMTQLQPWMAYGWSVFATDGIATVAASDTFFFFLVDANAVKELPGIPTVYALEQNYPNPFNPSTNFKFQIPEAGFVSLKVFDIEGREVAVLVSEQLSAGIYQTTWNAHDVAGGIYFVTLRTNNFVETKKITLLR
ncbi:MAG: T9SS type A sorting domain-containing protein [Ignavibacteriales bacterium]|nr:T9SS type A sorting domain-containing protein [Ignavibacteriales bacterium]